MGLQVMGWLLGTPFCWHSILENVVALLLRHSCSELHIYCEEENGCFNRICEGLHVPYQAQTCKEWRMCGEASLMWRRGWLL